MIVKVNYCCYFCKALPNIVGRSKVIAAQHDCFRTVRFARVLPEEKSLSHEL